MHNQEESLWNFTEKRQDCQKVLYCMVLVRTVSQKGKAIYGENKLVYKGWVGREKLNVSRNVELQVLLGEIKALCHTCSNSDNIYI